MDDELNRKLDGMIAHQKHLENRVGQLEWALQFLISYLYEMSKLSTRLNVLQDFLPRDE